MAPAVKVVSADRLDAAVLDINLGKELSFPIADTLAAADVPKPFHPEALVAELAWVLAS